MLAAVLQSKHLTGMVILIDRDRLFEAGFDDDMLVNGSSMATSDVAKYMSVGIGAAVGAALFAVNYWREQEMLKAIQVRPRYTSVYQDVLLLLSRLVHSCAGAVALLLGACN